MILLPIDIKLNSGIALMGNTKITRQRNGNLRISGYKTVCYVKGSGALYLWGVLKCLIDPSVKKDFKQWLSEYHKNVMIMGREPTSMDINYEEFLTVLSDCFHIFIP